MTTPKDAEAIVRYIDETFHELGNYHAIIGGKGMCKCGINEDGTTHNCNDFLKEQIKTFARLALASYTMHLKGELPKKRYSQRSREAEIEDSELDIMPRNYAIDEVHALLDEKIRKLTL